MEKIGPAQVMTSLIQRGPLLFALQTIPRMTMVM